MRAYLLLAALGALVFLPWLGARDLWNPDEPRYAEVAREMAASGDWLVPRLAGELYTQKPPLLFWSIDLAALATGSFDETAARLPSALAAIGTTLLVFWLGARLFDRRTAWLAALVFASSFKVLWQGRTAQIDMLLTFLVTASLACFVRGFLDDRPGFYWLYFACAGLATLAKGPVGLLPPLLAIVAFLLLSGRRDALRRLRIARGLLLWAGVVALWLGAAAARAGGAYLRELVVTQNLTRYFAPGSTPATAGHLRPFYHYLGTLPADFLPWSLLLPGALWVAWRNGSWQREAGFRFALCGAAVPFLFFTLSPAKRSVYLLPIFPALALLVAHHLRIVQATWPRHRAPACIPLMLAALLAACGAVLLPRWAAGRPEAAVVGSGSMLLLAALVGIVAVAAVGAAGLAWRNRQLAATATLAGAILALGPLALGALLPRADPLKSARRIAEELASRLAPGEPYGIFPLEDGRVTFYSRRLGVVLRDERALRDFAQSGEERWVVARRQDLDAVRGPLPYEEVTGDQRSEGGMVLLRARRVQR